MITKLFQVRDRATNMSVMAVKLGDEESSYENHILAHAGYGLDPKERSEGNYVILVDLNGGRIAACGDPFSWEFISPGRTLREAHLYLLTHFDELQSGDVIDVEYINNETDTCKTFE